MMPEFHDADSFEGLTRSRKSGYVNDESGLHLILLENEHQVVLSPQGKEDTGEVIDSEVVLRSVLVDHDSLTS
jgi:hypothetical protein